jgi:hypothetical protein
VVSDPALAMEFDGAETRVVRRITAKPVRNIKTDRSWTVLQLLRGQRTRPE